MIPDSSILVLLVASILGLPTSWGKHLTTKAETK